MVSAHAGLADPRAYVRLAAMLRQQIGDGKLQPGERTPSLTALAESTDTRHSPAARRYVSWKAKGC